MPQSKNYIATDLGASSGRAMLGSIDGYMLSLEECYRFPNEPIEQEGSLRWDFQKIFSEIKTGIGAAVGRDNQKDDQRCAYSRRRMSE